jgi:endoglucanase
VDKAAADPVLRENLADTLHFYAASHQERLRNKAQRALDFGAALLVTEWGTSESSGGGKLDREEVAAWIEFMDRNRLTWCNWAVSDKRETSAALLPGAAPNGGWSDEALSPSGRLVRELLRKEPVSSPVESR